MRLMKNLTPSIAAILLGCMLALLVGCGGGNPNAESGSGSGSNGGKPKVLRVPLISECRSMDPADGSTMYDNRCVVQVYETLLQYKYLKRPLELEPLLLSEMPTQSEDGLTYHFTLKPDVYFQDDECFPDGKGRQLVAADVIYSLKRLADSDVSLKNWWVMENTIVGFDEYKEAQNAAATFDYDAPVDGLKIINDREFEITLKEPVQRFMWTLAMFQTAVVPREAVEHHQAQFARHPVGTGPFRMVEWVSGKSMAFERNPTYHACTYPSEHMPEDETFGFDKAAGTKLPIVDRVEVGFYPQSQPMWLQFRNKNLDFTTVPNENFDEAYNPRTKKLRPDFVKEGITAHAVPLLDFIFYGFNMEDELLGGYTEEKKNLRRAISLAIDWQERNRAFYNNVCVIYDGMIPPGLEGYPADGKGPVNWRGPDLEKARDLLAKAGYPNGEGLPTINYYSSKAAQGQEMAEMTQRQLKEIGVNINPILDDFPAFMEEVNKKKAPLFAFAWHSDYPDAENNLALFYGPNEAPGSNHFNYKNAEFDKLYQQIRVMAPSPERTAIYEKMRDMVIEDAPYIGSLARTRHYLINPRLKNFKPVEDFNNWYKYLDVE
ncbi:MAG: hypothetical protein KDA87_09905 [Planctomycetales bacterium]|nr:hypothetical protein [Planctomycetales bacterium]